MTISRARSIVMPFAARIRAYSAANCLHQLRVVGRDDVRAADVHPGSGGLGAQRVLVTQQGQFGDPQPQQAGRRRAGSVRPHPPGSTTCRRPDRARSISWNWNISGVIAVTAADLDRRQQGLAVDRFVEHPQRGLDLDRRSSGEVTADAGESRCGLEGVRGR